MDQFKEFLIIPFRRREDFKRAQILLLCSIFLVGEMVWMLDLQLMVLYTKDRFSWDQHTLMEYNTYNFALMVVGQFICFPFLVKVLKLPLMLIGCLTCISRGGYYAMLASCNRLGKQNAFFILYAHSYLYLQLLVCPLLSSG